MKTEGGKGSKPRPFTDRKKFDNNWDAIFGKKIEPEKEVPEGEHSLRKAVNQTQSE